MDFIIMAVFAVFFLVFYRVFLASGKVARETLVEAGVVTYEKSGLYVTSALSALLFAGIATGVAALIRWAVA